MGQVSKGGIAKIRSGAAPQEMQREGSSSGNSARVCEVAEAVRFSNELRNSAHVPGACRC